MVSVVRSRTARAAAATAVVLFFATACQSSGLVAGDGQGVGEAHGGVGQNAAGGTPATAAAPSPTPTPATVTVSPAHGATGITPDKPVVVTATTGTLRAVTVTSSKGAAVKGVLAPSGTWTSTQRLAPDTAYRVTAEATGPDGMPTTKTSTFRTLKPAVTATYGILNAGMTVGVGMPVSIQFDSAVATPAQRAQVEKLVTVTTIPKTKGAWGWLDNRQLMWRPVEYWAPGTKVSINAPLTGVQTGPGKWVANDDNASFTIGSSMVSTVDIKRHTMTVRRGGEVVRVIPVSTGKPGALTETRSGTKVIIRKEGHVVMDSTTLGIPKGHKDYYRTETDWNLRVTWTGEYLHSAPWSVGAQGSANVSHGCVNMSPANARWMFENSKVGDVVTFTGSSRPFLPHEGIGVWQYSFASWQAQSALI